MKNILVGIDGSERSQCALGWAAALADREEGTQLTLLAIIDPGSARLAGSDETILKSAVDSVLGTAKEHLAKTYPNLSVQVKAGKGDVVEALIAAADEYDIVVLGSHHNKTVGEKVFGAKGLRVASAASVATAVIPSDYSTNRSAKGIVVGVGPDDASNDAVVLGVTMALAFGEPLELVSAWGIPTLISRTAEVMGGGLQPVGEMFQRKLDTLIAQIKEAHPTLEVTGRAVEGSSPTQVVMEYSEGKRMLLLGTHARSRVSRALFGSVTFGVLSRLEVPTIVVPEKNA